MPKKRETLIVRAIKDRLNEDEQSFFFKIHGGPMQMAGISDLIGIYKGRFVAIEVKTPENREGATKIQKWFLKNVNICGGLGFVSTSVEETIEKIDMEFKKEGL